MLVKVRFFHISFRDLFVALIVQLEYTLLFSLPREGTLQRAVSYKLIESSVSWFKGLQIASLKEAKFAHEKQIPKYNAFCDKLVLCMICKMFLKL